MICWGSRWCYYLRHWENLGIFRVSNPSTASNQKRAFRINEVVDRFFATVGGSRAAGWFPLIRPAIEPLPSGKLTNRPWKSPSFLVNTIKMVNFPWRFVSLQEGICGGGGTWPGVGWLAIRNMGCFLSAGWFLILPDPGKDLTSRALPERLDTGYVWICMLVP